MRIQVTWIIYPLLNPDGYAYSWNVDRLWRKNRRFNQGSTCIGVDLNRNYDINWMEEGTSSNPCSNTYGGTESFSESESQAHRNDIINMINQNKTIKGESSLV